MEKKYSVEEILSAVQDLNNLKKNTSKIALKKPKKINVDNSCLLYTSPSPRDRSLSRMPSSA